MSERNWTESVFPNAAEASKGTRILWVEDGTCGHYTELGTTESIESALDNYTSTYEAGEEPQELLVTWILFEDGEKTKDGRHTWDYQPN